VKESKQAIKPIDAPDYNYWQGFYLAFYSSRFYVDVIKRWSGFGMLYLWLLLAILTLPWSISLTQKINHHIDDTWLFPIEQMPLLVAQNGEISIDKPEPYFIKNKAGDLAIEIDTNSDLKAFPEDYPTLFMFITKNKMFFRVTEADETTLNHLIDQLLPSSRNNAKFSNSKVHQFNLDKNVNEIFSGRDWVKDNYIRIFQSVLLLFIYLVLLGFFYGFYFIGNFLMASIGRVISSVIIKHTITYKQSIRLAMVASTASIILLNIKQYFAVHVPGFGYFYFILIAFYFSLGVILVKRESQRLVRP
jgi:hypothetical protein